MTDAIKALGVLKAQLRESEERYRTLFESLDEGFCVIEKVEGVAGALPDFRFVEANPAFAAQSGLSGVVDVVGKTMRQLFPGEVDGWLLTYDTICRTGGPIRFERDFATLGRVLELYAFRVADHTLCRVAVNFHDITGRKRAEEALRQSEARFRALLNSGAVAIYSCDRAGKILEINRAAIDLWGCEPKPGETDVQFRGAFKALRPDGSRLPYAETWMTRVLKGDIAAVRDEEVSNERPDGSRITVIVNVLPLKNEQGEITGAMLCFYDVTERSRLEQETQAQAQALAELDHRKNEFLAMLGHELRNPLAALSNAVQLLHRQKHEEPLLQQGRAIIERQLGHLTHLVDDLLEVSRISSGSVRLRQQTVNLSGIVERALETAQPLILQHRHQLTLALPPEPIFLLVDATRLEQVLVNLLNNAAKYTHDGGRIDLSVESAGDQVVIRVRDNGIGIELALLPHIFELFTQAERSLDRSQGGLGIGLSLVQRLVQLHGGTVEAHSVLGQGSEFVVRLPVMPLLLTSLPESPTNDSAQQPKKASSRCRVLVVDDNIDAAQSMAKLLEMTGQETRLAYDGPSALQAALDYRPDVVLLDIGLPGLDGYEVAERIRQQATLKNVVLVALTGYGQDIDRQHSQAAGFDHHLVKPCNFDEIEKILDRVASLRKV